MATLTSEQRQLKQKIGIITNEIYVLEKKISELEKEKNSYSATINPSQISRFCSELKEKTGKVLSIINKYNNNMGWFFNKY